MFRLRGHLGFFLMNFDENQMFLMSVRVRLSCPPTNQLTAAVFLNERQDCCLC